jgi:polysaccharide export outer membrane protein
MLMCTMLLQAAPAQTPPPPKPAPQSPAPQTSPGAARQVTELPDGYVIGPEDVLGIVFWRETEISGDVTVRPDGRITVPVIGELAATGLTPEQLRKEIQTQATKYINDPNVTVVVRTINSRKIFVTGRVADPGTFDMRSAVTVMQAIALAGGLTDYADPKNITVLRKRNGQTQVLKFNYRDVAKGKNLEQNVALQPGDTVVVP